MLFFSSPFFSLSYHLFYTLWNSRHEQPLSIPSCSTAFYLSVCLSRTLFTPPTVNQSNVIYAPSSKRNTASRDESSVWYTLSLPLSATTAPPPTIAPIRHTILHNNNIFSLARHLSLRIRQPANEHVGLASYKRV